MFIPRKNYVVLIFRSFQNPQKCNDRYRHMARFPVMLFAAYVVLGQKTIQLLRDFNEKNYYLSSIQTSAGLIKG
jgi:hypothetical protein